MIYFSDFAVADAGFVPVSTDFPTVINTPTVTDGTESLLMQGTVRSGSATIRALLKSLPGGDFSVIVGVRARQGFNVNSAGIVFRDSASKFIAIHNVHNTSIVSVIDQYSTSTAFASAVSGARTHGSSNAPIWLKATFTSATNDVEGFYSYTGDNWVSLGTSTYLGTADAFGIGMNNDMPSGSTAPIAQFFHFEVV